MVFDESSGWAGSCAWVAEGRLWKAYENDGVLLPSDTDGTIEGQRLCRWWSSRQAFESEDSYELHYQRTETVAQLRALLQEKGVVV